MIRRKANYRAYCEMAKAGVPAATIQLAFEQGDLENIQDDVMKAYWAHVRDLWRKAPVLMEKIDAIASSLSKTAEEVLDAIATAHFPRLTIAVEQRNHNMIRTWINEMYDDIFN